MPIGEMRPRWVVIPTLLLLSGSLYGVEPNESIVVLSAGLLVKEFLETGEQRDFWYVWVSFCLSFEVLRDSSDFFALDDNFG